MERRALVFILAYPCAAWALMGTIFIIASAAHGADKGVLELLCGAPILLPVQIYTEGLLGASILAGCLISFWIVAYRVLARRLKKFILAAPKRPMA